MLKVVSYNEYPELKEFLSKKNPEFATSELIDQGVDSILNLALGFDLFNKKGNYYFYFQDDLLKDTPDHIYFWDSLIDSPHIFWVIKEKNSVDIIHNEQKKYELINLVKNKATKERENFFEIGDFFIAGDKKNAWLAIDKCEQRGDPAELVFYTFWWQIKILYSVMVAGNASGHKPFNISKAQNVIKKVGNQKIIKWKNDLADLYFNRFESGLDLYTLLKKYILES